MPRFILRLCANCGNNFHQYASGNPLFCSDKCIEVLRLEDAAKAGFKHYFTGIKCYGGHLSPRIISNNDCVDCLREWKAKNSDRVKELNAKSRALNRESIRLKAEAKRLNFSDDINRQKREWREKNKERERLSGRIYAARRKARLLSVGGTYERDDIARIIKAQKCCCAICKKKLKDYHIDHIVPLSSGGKNEPKNLQILCPQCNKSKGARDPIDHMRRLGFLL